MQSSIGMKPWDPTALLARHIGPLCSITVDHFEARNRMRSAGWSSFYGWRVERRGGTPLSRQIYMQARGAVLNGVLTPGSALPSSRAMASRLGVARACVVAAYDQLATEGYVESRRGSGTFVCADLRDLVGPARRRTQVDLAKPRPVPAPAKAFAEFERSATYAEGRPFNTGRTLIDARTLEAWRKLTHQAVRSLGTYDLGYTDPAGSMELRASICEYLQAARAVRCRPEQIVITAGTQHAIDIAIRVVLVPGDDVWVEDPGYPLTHAQLLLAKVRPHAIPVDRHGILVDAGLRLAPKARAAFVTPSHQFPTGVVLSMPRRLELLAWARKSGAFIVEDDYTSEFRYSGPPLASLQGLDEDERVIYVGTLNKALFPGLRLGYAGRVPCLGRLRQPVISMIDSLQPCTRRFSHGSCSRGTSRPMFVACVRCTASSETRWQRRWSAGRRGCSRWTCLIRGCISWRTCGTTGLTLRSRPTQPEPALLCVRSAGSIARRLRGQG
jgi:GntR family transcriptional regulator / MocR family aminotransferase